MALELTDLLGPGGAVVVTVTVLQVVQKIKENRAARRMGLDAQFQARYAGDVMWINAYRSCAELHGRWDVEVRITDERKNNAINRLEEKLGMVPTKFEPLATPPPLFPQLDDHGNPIAHGDAHAGDQRS
jgi:hypothetical protein